MLGAGDDLKAGVWQRLVQTRGLFKERARTMLPSWDRSLLKMRETRDLLR